MELKTFSGQTSFLDDEAQIQSIYRKYNCWVGFEPSFDASLTNQRNGMVCSWPQLRKKEDGMFEDCPVGCVWVSYHHNGSDRQVQAHLNDLFPAKPKGKGEEVFIFSGQHAGKVGKVSKWSIKNRVATVVVDGTAITVDFSSVIKVTPAQDSMALGS